ncbi:MAG: 1-(5-phosphoribosyl)-5-[(5-phosphoribosylamino)methylideneamino]imidazole-4-carboxamide isomerase [Firmicutes bacterium]|nr:1-(5-phosphoribosyl)-5-[(5-phosphoribosylamino)methylideneamino]imidazole-4-carboxamide isomerase [Bacillota bacterium]
MKVIPAIDLMGGACVRLFQGDFGRATIYGRDPVAVARSFAEAGAGLIHLVDLDGARCGRPVQREAILAVAAAVPVPVEVGGGVRTMAEIEAYLEHGVARVVLGSAAVKDPALLRAAVARYGERIVLGLDARGGRVAVEGWSEVSDRDALGFAKEMAAMGVRELIYTDVARDGTLSGPNLEGLSLLVRESGMRVIASGGISSLADLEAVAGTGAAGAIVGKALYDGRLDLRAAVKLLEGMGDAGQTDHPLS